MTTLITGATGFLGHNLTRALIDREQPDIRLLLRSTSDHDRFTGWPVTILKGDLLDRPSLDAALSGVDTLYHTAGWIDFAPKNADKVYAINATGTLNLFEAALQAGVRRVIYAASIFALGFAHDPTQPATADHAFNGAHLLDIPYVRAKRDVEIRTDDLIAGGLPLIRIYAGICLGPGDINLSSSGSIALWLQGRLPALIDGGGVCMMDVRDAAAAFLAAGERGAVGAKYLATGYNLTLRDLFTKLSEITGKPAPRLYLPPAIGIPVVRLTEKLGLFPALDSAQVRLMAHHWWYNSAQTEQSLQIGFRPLEDTLRVSVKWLQNNLPRGLESLVSNDQ